MSSIYAEVGISKSVKLPYPITPEAFAKRAKQGRAARDVADAQSGRKRPNDTELAEEINELIGENVSGGQVGRWLNKGTIPESLARLWALARVLGVDPGWLMFGEESSAEGPSLLSSLPKAAMTLEEGERDAKKRR